MSDSHEMTKNPEASESLTAIVEHYRALHRSCTKVLDTSLSGEHARTLASSHAFLGELDQWGLLIAARRESALLVTAAKEYQFGLLASAHGMYRHAFKSLRLTLELIHQAVFLSANEIQLREWLGGRRDTNWAVTNDEQNGVLSKTFAKAFAPALEEHVCHYRSMVAQLYRECSECIHGNVEKHIPLPPELVFDEPTFGLWNEKAEIVALCSTFVLCLRYVGDFQIDRLTALQTPILERLGHIVEIRNPFGACGGGTI